MSIEGNRPGTDEQAHPTAASHPQVPRFVVLLVHGTFAPKARWAQESSRLVKRLREAFGEELAIRRFNWTGHNSHQHRLRAGDKLRRVIQGIKLEHATSPLFIISHSHGGNIVGYALRESEAAAGVTGCIFMATPFLRVAQRELGSALKLLSWTTPLLLAPLFCAGMFALMFFAANYGDSDLKQWADGQNSIVSSLCAVLPWALLLAGLFSLGLLLKAGNFLSDPLPTRILAGFQEFQTRRMKELRWTLNPTLPVLVLRSKGDEAGLLLNSLSFLSETLPWVWRMVAPLTWLFAAAIIASYLLIGLEVFSDSGRHLLELAVGALSHLPHSTSLGNSPDSLFFWSLAVFFSWILFLLLLQAMMAALPLLIRAHSFGFGGESVFDNWLLRIQTHAVPDTVVNASIKEYSLDSLRSRLSWRLRYTLRHSVYEQEEALTAIVHWLRQQDPQLQPG